MRASLLCVALLLVAMPSLAADVLRPDPALSAAEVVETQLSALQRNDTPEAEAGIVQTWAFAHPDNKRMTGPLPRFAQMIKGPPYRMLIDHQAHEVEEVSRTDDAVVFAVTVTTDSSEVLIYQWQVRKVAQGRNAGAWMTSAVSPPVSGGNAI